MSVTTSTIMVCTNK